MAIAQARLASLARTTSTSRVGSAPERVTAPAGGDLAGAPVPTRRRRTRPDWPRLLAETLARGAVHAVYQPIVDVAKGTVAGYEALARFPRLEGAGPEEWFSAARRHGMAGRLEASALRAAFARRSLLPAGAFLAVNVTPTALADRAVAEVLADEDDLSGVVIELTEQTPIDDYSILQPHLDRCRAAGAIIAVDDAGSGYAGLRHLLDLRPAIIKLDGQLVSGIHRDEAKRVLVEMLGTFCARTDSWMVAEGIEHDEELDVIANLGVPLAQGYLLGRPAPPWAPIEPGPAHRLRHRQPPATPTGTLRDLVESCPTAATVEEGAAVFAARPDVDTVVLLDRHGRPAAVADPELLALGVTTDALRVELDTPIHHAAQRAVSRTTANRFQPLVCTEAGRYAGIVRVERMVSRLAAG